MDLPTQHRQNITGTAASVLAGVNPYKTLEQLWLEMTGQVVNVVPKNKLMDRGIRLEDVALDLLAEQEGLELRRSIRLTHPFKPSFGANLDAIFEKEGQAVPGIADAKVAGYETLAYIRENGVPAYWQAQLQWYGAMLVDSTPELAAKKGEVQLPLCNAVLDPNGWSLTPYFFDSDPAIQRELKWRATEFLKCVASRTPPPAWEPIAFPVIHQKTLALSPELQTTMEAKLARYAELKARKIEIENELSPVEEELKALYEEHGQFKKVVVAGHEFINVRRIQHKLNESRALAVGQNAVELAALLRDAVAAGRNPLEDERVGYLLGSIPKTFDLEDYKTESSTSSYTKIRALEPYAPVAELENGHQVAMPGAPGFDAMKTSMQELLGKIDSYEKAVAEPGGNVDEAWDSLWRQKQDVEALLTNKASRLSVDPFADLAAPSGDRVEVSGPVADEPVSEEHAESGAMKDVDTQQESPRDSEPSEMSPHSIAGPEPEPEMAVVPVGEAPVEAVEAEPVAAPIEPKVVSAMSFDDPFAGLFGKTEPAPATPFGNPGINQKAEREEAASQQDQVMPSPVAARPSARVADPLFDF